MNISFASRQMNRDVHFTTTIHGSSADGFSYALCGVPSKVKLTVWHAEMRTV